MSSANAFFALLLGIGFIALGMAEPAMAKAGNGTNTLACEVTLVGSDTGARAGQPLKLEVAGREVVLGLAKGPAGSLRVHPADATSVLVAVAYAGSGGWDPRGSDSLWRVPCEAGARPTTVARVEGADFAHSALARDGRRLFYSGEDGIFALDLRTWQSRRVTKAAFPLCRQNSFAARDVVGELDASGALLFERGCHYEWEWHGQSMRLRRPESRKPVVEPAPRPPLAAVAVDAGGGIWLSDGWCGDRSTYQRLLHSTDRGKSWQSVRVERDPKLPTDDQRIRQIIADANNPSALLVFTQSCASSDQHTEPDWIYVTEDGGATFRAMGIPPGLSDPLGQGPLHETNPLWAISAQQGSLSDLILYGDSSDRTGDTIGRWSSRDLGRTWKALGAVRMSIDALSQPAPLATHGDWKVAIEPDGLYLLQPGKRSRALIYRRR